MSSQGSGSSSAIERLGARFEAALGALAALCYRRAPLAGAVLVVLGLGLFRASQGLRIDTDMTRLLPDSFESVREVRSLSEEFGGVGYVSVVATGKDRAQLVHFADAAAAKLSTLPTVRYVDYRRPVGFFKDRGLYYLDPPDLETVRDRLTARRDWEVSRGTGSLLDDDEEPPAVQFDDLETKYRERFGLARDKTDARTQGGARESEYYLDATGTKLVLLVKPTKLASDFGFVKQVVGDVEGSLASLDRGALGDGLSWELSGRYKKRVDLQKTLGHDLQVASITAFLLVLGYIALHFRRLSAVVLVFVPLAFTLSATYGTAALTIGSLNILTSFIGAILLGIAIDSGIHLLGRYDEERAKGLDPESAIRGAFGEAGRATAAATLTNVGAFLCLVVADFKAFREFGILAACGMAFTLLGYLTALPVLLGLLTRLRPGKPAPEAPPLALARPIVKYAKPIFAAMTLLLVFAMTRLPSARFNYDFAALDEADLPSFKLDKEVNAILGQSQTPLVVLAKTPADAASTAEELRARARARGSASTIDRVLSPTDLVPDGQGDKTRLLREIGEVAEGLREERLDDRQLRRRNELVRMAAAEPFARGDLPVEVRRQFARPGSDEMADFVLVYPSVSMSDGRKAQLVAEEVRGLAMADGRKLHAAGEPLVLADILTSMQQQLPIVFGLALLQQIVILWAVMGSFKRAALTIFPALVTMPLLVGLVRLAHLELNYLNVILLPVLLGMGEDGGAHLVARVGAGERLGDALGHTARATLGAGITTVFGFGAMVLAAHPGLRMFGAVAMLGIGLNLVVCIFFLPSLMALLERARPRGGAALTSADRA